MRLMCRHPRARLPDRHHADHDAQAQQRPLSLRFPNLGVDYMIHHLLSHSDTADWLKVNQFFLEQVAYIARKLDAIQEGPRTLLDNSMLLFCSSMLTGNHDATPAAGDPARRRRRANQRRSRAGLLGKTRPADVPPVSLDDGQDERSASDFRRRLASARRSLIETKVAIRCLDHASSCVHSPHGIPVCYVLSGYS